MNRHSPAALALELNPKVSRFIQTLPLLLVATDVAARLSGGISSIAAFFWLVVTLFTWAVPFVALFFWRRSFVAAAAVLGLLAMSVWNGLQWRFVNAEATQQMTCLLAQFAGADKGFLSTCFYQYPTRGYYLAGIPSLLFGQSAGALDIGEHLIVYSGAAAFALGISGLGSGARGFVIFGLALLIAFGGLHTPSLLLSYEQSAFPFALALQFTGFMLLFWRTSSPAFLALATNSAILSAFSYTPALSLTGLAAVLLLLIYLECRNLWYGAFGASVAIAGVLSALTRHDYSFSAEKGGYNSLALHPAAWNPLLSISWKNPLLHPGMALAVTILIWSIQRAAYETRSADAPDGQLLPRHPVAVLALLGCWSLATVLMSTILSGHSAYFPVIAVYRATLIFPVLGGTLTWLSFRRRGPGPLLSVLMVIATCIITGSLGSAYATKVDQIGKVGCHPLEIMRMARQFADKPEFAVPSPPDVFFRGPAVDLACGNDYNQYFRLLRSYKSVAQCPEIPAGRPPAVLIWWPAEQPSCPELEISQCLDVPADVAYQRVLCRVAARTSVTAAPPPAPEPASISENSRVP